MMVFARGLAKWTSGGMKVSTAIKNADETYRYVDIPAVFRRIDSRILGDNVAVVSVIFLASAAVVWLLLSRYRWGRHLYAIGGNEAAAHLCGLPWLGRKPWPTRLRAFWPAWPESARRPRNSKATRRPAPATIDAIAMVVIGGTSLAGGQGGIGLTLIGVLTIGYLDKILSINAVPEAAASCSPD